MDEQHYQVNNLIDYKVENGQQFVKVEWVGYSLSQSTWEPIHHIICMEDFVEQYQELKSSYSQRSNKRGKREMRRQHYQRFFSQVQEQEQSKNIYNETKKHDFKLKSCKKIPNCLKNQNPQTTSKSLDSENEFPLKVQQRQNKDYMYERLMQFVIQNEKPNQFINQKNKSNILMASSNSAFSYIESQPIKTCFFPLLFSPFQIKGNNYSNLGGLNGQKQDSHNLSICN